MSDLFATSPDRFDFWIENAKKSLEKSPEDYGIKKLIEFYEKCKKENSIKKEDTNDLSNDLRSTFWIVEKCKNSKKYSQNLYAALCNNKFKKIKIDHTLDSFVDKKLWSCSWRAAGGIVANLREQGDYLNFYCSGMEDNTDGTLPEGKVSSEIEEDLNNLGWVVCRDNK